MDADGNKQKHYFVKESVGIACGMLITALHNAGLSTLTHTLRPLGFLNDILNRPPYERPYLLVITGYPSIDTRVLTILEKQLSDIASFYGSGK